MSITKNYRFFYAPSSFAEEFLIACDCMGYESNSNFLIDRDHLNNFLIMYVIKEQIYVEQFGVKYTVKAGDGIVMDLRHKHKYYFDKSNGGSIIWLHFRGIPCNGIMERLQLAGKIPYIFTSDTVQSSMDSIFETTMSFDNSTEYTISSKVYSLLCELLNTAISDVLAKTEKGDPFISKVRSYIKSNVRSKIALDELSTYMNMSKYHFSHKFNKGFGMTLSDYIMQNKIALAKQLLTCTNDSISQISEALSFSDQSHFTNVFKHATGVTPREYRKHAM